MIKIRYIKNVFENKKETEVDLQFSFNFTLRDYLDLSKIDYSEKNIIVSSGKKELNDYLLDGDIVTLTDKVNLDVIAFDFFYVVLGFIYYHPIISLYIAFAIYSAMSSPRKPSFGGVGSGMDESSPTYGWDGIQTTQSTGIPIPVVYGEHKVGGQIINQYIRTNGDKNYLNVLLALSEGDIESIDSLEINGNPATNFSNVTQTKRYGTNTQTMIPNFHDLHNASSLSVELAKNVPYIYTTSKDDVEVFEATLSASNGLFSSSREGGISSMSITYLIEYKLHDDVDWISLGIQTISGKTQSTLKRVFRKEGLTAGKYDVRFTKTSKDSTLDPQVQCDLFLTLFDEITTEDLNYPNVALLGIEALAEEQLNGSMPNFTCIVKGRKVSVPQIMYGGSQVDWEDYYWDSSTEEYKRFEDDAVCSWDGTTFVNQWSANPIWCMRDFLTNTRYGLGDYISSSAIDNDSLLDMSRYCEEKVSDGDSGYEKRFRLDVVFDSKSRALDLISQICSTFRAFYFYSNGTVILKIDKAEDPVQMFGMGNIVKSSFIQSWKSIKERNQAVEVQFLDSSKNYEQDIVSVFDESAITDGEPLRTKTVKVFCTRISQAIREGKYALLVSKYINRTITLKASIDAVGCQAGDIINVAHDVPQWGFSGRVQDSSTTTLIKLDREVVLSAGTTYKISIQFADDTIEEKKITSVAGTYTEVECEAFSQTPAYQDKYSLGEENIVVKPFRVIGLKRSGDSEIEINAIEYNADVYDTDTIVLPQTNYSALSFNLPDVDSLTLTERIVKLQDGTIEDVIDVYWNKPDLLLYPVKRYLKAKVYLSDDDGASWEYRGESSGTGFSIQGGLVDLNTYLVAVCSVSDAGEENAIDDSPQEEITILGKQAKPSDVLNFDGVQQSNFLKFTWSAIEDPDLARYVIKQGNDWETGVVIGEAIDTTDFLYPVGMIGEIQFMIKAIDTSGNESVGFGFDIVNVTLPPDSNFINNYDLFQVLDNYILNKCCLETSNDFDTTYARNRLSLATQKTWEELEAEGQTWEYQEANSGLLLDRPVEASGYFEMVNPIDLQIVFDFKLTIDAEYVNASDGHLTIKISVSEDGITYSSYETLSANTYYRGRYIKFKIELSTDDTAQNISLYKFMIYVEAPTSKQAYGNDLLVAVGGTHIIFGVGFVFPPRITASVVNGVVGFPVFENKDEEGVDVKVYNVSGSAIGTAEIDWVARGF